MDINQEHVESFNRNWGVVLKNFTKISSWLKKGSESEYPMPPVVLGFLEKFNSVAEQVEQASAKTDTVANELESLAKAVSKLNTVIESQNGTIAALTERLETLEGYGNTAPAKVETQPEPAKPAPKTKSKPKAAEPPKDQIELSAEAVDAGEVSVAGLDQISSMIEGLLPATTATPESEVDEL
jgi:hypothetical protein